MDPCINNLSLVFSLLLLFVVALCNSIIVEYDRDINVSAAIVENEKPYITATYTKNCFGAFERIIGELKAKYGDQTRKFIGEKINEFRVNLDLNSEQALLYAGECMNSYLQAHTCPPITNYQAFHFSQYQQELKTYPKKYKCSEFLQEVFYFHHGLRFAHQKIRDYVKERDMLDIGAYVGDSMIVLSNYTNKKVYSYEFSPVFFNHIINVIEANNLKDKVVLVKKGISSKKGTIYVKPVFGAGGGITDKGNTPVPIVTIDDEVSEKKIQPGFIKADVEGVGLEVLRGASKTIEKYRPVLEVACYHSYDEFFDLPIFMKQFPNYLWEYHSENTNTMSMGEIAFFAYPAEIVYNIN